jgi:predicted nucleic acid-binding protein
VKKQKAFIDTNILVKLLRKSDDNKKASKFLNKLLDHPNYELCISHITLIEILLYMRPHEEEETRDLLTIFTKVALDEDIIEMASNLHRQLKIPKTDLMDTLTAATCKKHMGHIYTFNTKHFYKIPGIKVHQPWS